MYMIYKSFMQTQYFRACLNVGMNNSFTPKSANSMRRECYIQSSLLEFVSLCAALWQIHYHVRQFIVVWILRNFGGQPVSASLLHTDVTG